MQRVVVVGGSLAGMHAALSLARRGHDVTVLERDVALPPPPDVVAGWDRPGTPQLWHSHAFIGRYVQLLRRHTPDLLEALQAAGAHLIRLADHLPPPISDRAPRPADDDLVVLGCRRPVVDAVVRRYVESYPEVRFHTGVTARALVVEPGAVPTVRGVITDQGVYYADVVVDASGRRSRIGPWLADHDVTIDDGAEAPCGNVYYTRHYRRPPGVAPQQYVTGFSQGAMLDAMAFVSFPGEHDVHTVSIQIEDDDVPLRVLRDADAFTAAARAVPSFAERVDPSHAEPISPVYVMAGLRNRLRRLVVDGRPAVAGVHLIGDSLCITNPTFGRGTAHAASLGQQLAELVDQYNGADLTLAVDDAISQDIAPYFRNALARDMTTRARWRAVLYDEPSSVDQAVLAAAEHWDQAFLAGLTDRVVWEAVMRTSMLLSPPHATLNDTDVAMRIAAAVARGLPSMPAGPTRAAVLAAALAG